MKKRRLMMVLSLIILISLTTGILFLKDKMNNAQQEIQYLSASWPYNYSNLEEISKASDLIALIKVEGVSKSYEARGIPVTEYKVQVLEPIYGTDETQLILFMTGKEDKNKKIEIKDDPLPHADEEFLVFCKQNADGTTTVLSGPQGRLVYTDGKLNSLNAVNENAMAINSRSSIQIVNEDAETIIAQIKSYVE